MAKKKQPKTRRYYDPPVELLPKYGKARYYYILGARSTGKTYGVIKKAIQDAIDGNGVFVYARRYKESITTADMQDLVGVHGDWIAEYTKGQWNKVSYWQGRFYLDRVRIDDNGVEEREERRSVPIGTTAALSTSYNKRGPDFGGDKGGIAHIIMDECLSLGGDYLRNEWSLFQNMIATYIRDRWSQDTKIWLLSNPVSKFNNPYFRNIGITKQMIENPGTYQIDYPDEHGKPVMSAVFAHIAAILDENGKAIDIDENRTRLYNNFFAFQSSKGSSLSITHGMWEMADSANLPEKYLNDSETKLTIFFKVDEDDFLACDWCKYHGTNQYYMYFYHCDEILPDHYYFTLLPEMEKYAIIAGAKNHRVYQKFNEIYATNRLYYEDNSIADSFHAWCKAAKQYVP